MAADLDFSDSFTLNDITHVDVGISFLIESVGVFFDIVQVILLRDPPKNGSIIAEGGPAVIKRCVVELIDPFLFLILEFL